MGRLVVHTVILTIILIGCGSEDQKVAEKNTSKEPQDSSTASPYKLEDEHCIVNFPDAYKSDTIEANGFLRISHSWKSDSLHMAVEEIDYLNRKTNPNDSIYKSIHEGSVKSLVKTSRLIEITFSQAQNALGSVGKINGHDDKGNYTFLRYQVKEDAIIQIGIWSDSAHVADGEDILNSLVFKVG